MESFPNLITKLVSPWNGDKGLFKELEEFSYHLGWYPSDIIEEKNNSGISTGHLFVEYGLENSAVISFLNSDYRYNSLNELQKLNLFSISFNNLVDLHISVDKLNVAGSHNRLGNNNLLLYGLSKEEKNLKSSTYSELLQETRIRPIYKSLDNSLIDTISFWKRIISSELNNKVTNEQLSYFFNSLIFIRAIEDYRSKEQKNSNSNYLNKVLNYDQVSNYTEIIDVFSKDFKIQNFDPSIINYNQLKIFNGINHKTLFKLFDDFYTSKDSNYDYDFSIMSKHALSKIYEKYVSLLEVKETPQFTLFSQVPEEKFNKNSGSYYTPQYIARFFTKFLQGKIDLKNKELRLLEPAVGSGIFLRTFLEKQIELTTKSENAFFYNSYGIDKSLTACNAAKLSLSLLYLVSFGKLPSKALNIINEDSLNYFSKNDNQKKYNVIISNPPFIKYSSLDHKTRLIIKEFLGELSYGKIDLYVAFLKIALDNLEENGYGCFVLPNTFLTTDSAKHIRERIFSECNIDCIVDLSNSNHKIFEDASVYPILLIFSKTSIKSPAIVAKIQDNTGEALHKIYNNLTDENDNYSIYEVDQLFFGQSKWYLLPPTELHFKDKISKNPKISDFFDVRTGFSSGNTNAFILSRSNIPKGEEVLFKPYLKDREMKVYLSNSEVEDYLFYPYKSNKEKYTEIELKSDFPKTYNHLRKYQNDLSTRTEVIKNRIPWWMPNRPRSPKFMLTPKIVTPHLIFSPKFSVDFKGKYAVSRTPFLVPKKDLLDNDLLFYFVGILNSSVSLWYLLSHAPKYQNGFAMLEPTYLKNLPVPSPLQESSIKRKLVMEIINLVKERITSDELDQLKIEKLIDNKVAELYDLSDKERLLLSL